MLHLPSSGLVKTTSSFHVHILEKLYGCWNGIAVKLSIALNCSVGLLYNVVSLELLVIRSNPPNLTSYHILSLFGIDSRCVTFSVLFTAQHNISVLATILLGFVLPN